MSAQQQLSFVTVGHVDHGKSTVIGRLLADLHALPDGKLEQIKLYCERHARPFEYAYCLDALKDEQAQGITIDTARMYFQTERRQYQILDAPGHIEFIKNMVTGATRADAALLVIDAQEGIQENTRRHGYLLSMLGVKQLVVIVNKMDLVSYSEMIYEDIKQRTGSFFEGLGLIPRETIPVSARHGENIVNRAGTMPWYNGDLVIEAIESFASSKVDESNVSRLPIQAVYKFTQAADNRRIFAGTVRSGSFQKNDQLVFFPSGKTARIKSFEDFSNPLKESASVGEATGITLDQQIYVTRGEVAVRAHDPVPLISTRFRVRIFWLGVQPFKLDEEFLIKLGTARVRGRMIKFERIFDAATMEPLPKNVLDRHDVGEGILESRQALAADDLDGCADLNRFVIVQNLKISGGGIVLESCEYPREDLRKSVLRRNVKWEKSHIESLARAERYNQQAGLIVVTGERHQGRKRLAKALEKTLFEQGKLVYYLGIGNVLYGVDADIKGQESDPEEHLRRLAEVAHILLDAGLILILTAIELSASDLDLLTTVVQVEKLMTVWVGQEPPTDLELDLILPAVDDEAQAVAKVKMVMQDRGLIFRPG